MVFEECSGGGFDNNVGKMFGDGYYFNGVGETRSNNRSWLRCGLVCKLVCYTCGILMLCWNVVSIKILLSSTCAYARRGYDFRGIVENQRYDHPWRWLSSFFFQSVTVCC